MQPLVPHTACLSEHTPFELSYSVDVSLDVGTYESLDESRSVSGPGLPV